MCDSLVSTVVGNENQGCYVYDISSEIVRKDYRDRNEGQRKDKVSVEVEFWQSFQPEVDGVIRLFPIWNKTQLPLPSVRLSQGF